MCVYACYYSLYSQQGKATIAQRSIAHANPPHHILARLAQEHTQQDIMHANTESAPAETDAQADELPPIVIEVLVRIAGK